MAVLTAMLYVRYQDSRTPIALVSMDNCSHNGDLLRHSVLTMAREWQKKGYVTEDFLAWLGDETQVSFPWTMIDKITPRPGDAIAADPKALGVEDMAPVITSKRTYIAPFINAEQPQYLVIEDRFPNGRPELEKGFGVYLADRATVNLGAYERSTACLNPVHSRPVRSVSYSAGSVKMRNTNPDMMKMARMVAYDEGLPMVRIRKFSPRRRSPTNSSPIASRMSILAIQICGCHRYVTKASVSLPVRQSKPT